jgi:hypothetical protein
MQIDLSTADQPIRLAPPQPGQRIELDLAPDASIAFGFDLTGAQVDVVDGKIVITLPNGGEIVLVGDTLAEFLGTDVAPLEDALPAAAGDPDDAPIPAAPDLGDPASHDAPPIDALDGNVMFIDGPGHDMLDVRDLLGGGAEAPPIAADLSPHALTAIRGPAMAEADTLDGLL